MSQSKVKMKPAFKMPGSASKVKGSSTKHIQQTTKSSSTSRFPEPMKSEDTMLNRCSDLNNQMASIRRDIGKNTVTKAQYIHCPVSDTLSLATSVSSSPPRLNHTPLVIPTASVPESPRTLYPRGPVTMLPANNGTQRIPVTTGLNPKAPFNRRLVSSTPDPEKAAILSAGNAHTAANFTQNPGGNVERKSTQVGKLEKHAQKLSKCIQNTGYDESCMVKQATILEEAVQVEIAQKSNDNPTDLDGRMLASVEPHTRCLVDIGYEIPGKGSRNKMSHSVAHNVKRVGQKCKVSNAGKTNKIGHKDKAISVNKTIGSKSFGNKTAGSKRGKVGNHAKSGLVNVKRNSNDLMERKREMEKQFRLQRLLMQTIEHDAEGGFLPSKDICDSSLKHGAAKLGGIDELQHGTEGGFLPSKLVDELHDNPENHIDDGNRALMNGRVVGRDNLTILATGAERIVQNANRSYNHETLDTEQESFRECTGQHSVDNGFMYPTKTHQHSAVTYYDSIPNKSKESLNENNSALSKIASNLNQIQQLQSIYTGNPTSDTRPDIPNMDNISFNSSGCTPLTGDTLIPGDTPRSIDTPMPNNTPRSLDTPMSNNTPRSLDTPRSDSPRYVDTPKSGNKSVDTPKYVDTPKSVDTQKSILRNKTPNVKYSSDYPPSYNRICVTNSVNRSSHSSPNSSKITSDTRNTNEKTDHSQHTHMNTTKTGPVYHETYGDDSHKVQNNPSTTSTNTGTQLSNFETNYQIPTSSIPTLVHKLTEISDESVKTHRISENSQSVKTNRMSDQPDSTQGKLYDSGFVPEVTRLSRHDELTTVVARIKTLATEPGMRTLVEQLSTLLHAGDTASHDLSLPGVAQKSPSNAHFLDRMLLMSQLSEEREAIAQLKHDQRDLHTQLDLLKADRHKLLLTITEKDSEKAQCKQEQLQTLLMLTGTIDTLRRDVDSLTQHQQRMEQENHILSVSLTERDREISTLNHSIQEIKGSITGIIHGMENTSDHTSSTSYLPALRKLLKGDYPIIDGSKNLNASDILSVSKQDCEYSSSLTQTNIARHNSNTPFLVQVVDYQSPVKGTNNSVSAKNFNVTPQRSLDNITYGIPVNDVCIDTRNIGNFPNVLGSVPRNIENFPNLLGSVPKYSLGNDPRFNGNLQNVVSGTDPKQVSNDLYGNNPLYPWKPQTDNDDGSVTSEDVKNICDEIPAKFSVPDDCNTTQDTLVNDFVPNPGKRVQFDCNVSEVSSAEQIDERLKGNETETTISRYSVTDYFTKYPQTNTNEHSPDLPYKVFDDKMNNEKPNDKNDVYGVDLKTTTHFNDEVQKNPILLDRGQPIRQDFGDHCRGDPCHGDDGSTVSGFTLSSVSTLNWMDDDNFRNELARLDENILRVKQSLESSKDSLKLSL